MNPEELDVPVTDGTLRVCRWPGETGPTVLAAHGITANALSWAPVADALAGRATLIAADLRGRAKSNALPGPYGLAQHADDLIAVLDHLDLDRAPIVGHSMGTFVAAAAALRHPDRVSSVLLVDGGVTLQVPEGADVDAILEAVIGPAMRRLQMTFDSEEAYLDFWRGHPALSAAWSLAVRDYALRDLAGQPPELHSGSRDGRLLHHQRGRDRPRLGTIKKVRGTRGGRRDPSTAHRIPTTAQLPRATAFRPVARAGNQHLGWRGPTAATNARRNRRAVGPGKTAPSEGQLPSPGAALSRRCLTTGRPHGSWGRQRSRPALPQRDHSSPCSPTPQGCRDVRPLGSPRR
ncbi:alpha/beta fold hydrolase [Micromonospora coxensis]|uniref:alpha/beta fold hydrolase n=1 Tax=Micromonospora coxensis TaxID=356852 RepID=UPI0034270847